MCYIYVICNIYKILYKQVNLPGLIGFFFSLKLGLFNQKRLFKKSKSNFFFLINRSFPLM